MKDANEIYNSAWHARELLGVGAKEEDFRQIEEKLHAIVTLTECAEKNEDERLARAARLAGGLLAGACIYELKEMQVLIDGAISDLDDALAEPEPVVDHGHAPTEEELRDLYREKHTNIPDERRGEKKRGILK